MLHRIIPILCALFLTAAAHADYPDDCLGELEPSGGACGTVDFIGCCDGQGRALWCKDDALYCVNCINVGMFCGWMVGVGDWYGCMNDPTGPDPTGEAALPCQACEPPCGAGELCDGGACVPCAPDCDGKACGPDGCGGACGACEAPESCMLWECLSPGCVEGDGGGCDGCPCEACVCALDPYCCETKWDGACVQLCVADCGGCEGLETCGDGTCDPDAQEHCGSCPADCGCPGSAVCWQNACCEPSCGHGPCGYDGCGGSCGVCPEGAFCWDEDCAENPCDPGMVPDCDGACTPLEWLGDGWCDDARDMRWFDCGEHGWDMGDCEPETVDPVEPSPEAVEPVEAVEVVEIVEAATDVVPAPDTVGPREEIIAAADSTADAVAEPTTTAGAEGGGCAAGAPAPGAWALLLGLVVAVIVRRGRGLHPRISGPRARSRARLTGEGRSGRRGIGAAW